MKEIEINFNKRNEDGRLLFCVNIRISLERDFFHDEIYQKDENGNILIEEDTEVIFKNYRIDVFPMFYDIEYAQQTKQKLNELENKLDELVSILKNRESSFLYLTDEEKADLDSTIEEYAAELLKENEFQHNLLPDFLLSFDKRNLNEDFIDLVKEKYEQTYFADIYLIREQQNKILEKSPLILYGSGDENDDWLINWLNTIFFYMEYSADEDFFEDDELNDPFIISKQEVLKSLRIPELIDFVLDNPHLHYLGSPVLTDHFKLPFPVLFIVEENSQKTKAKLIGFIRLENTENQQI